MKYEVEIIGTEPNVLLEILSRSFHKVSVTPVHEIHGKQNTYVYNSRLSEPPYSRAQVICELWEPKEEEDCFGISPENKIIWYHNYAIAPYKTTKDIGYVFAPSKELAEEIVQIRLGKWLPKNEDGDCGVWACPKNDFRTNYYNGSTCYHARHFDNSLWHIFPSEKQRDTFIEKQKEKAREERLLKCKHGYFINILVPCSECFLERFEDEKHFSMKIFGKEIYIENGFLKVR